MQLADSFFPSGLFSTSSGLEPLVKSGVIRNGKDVLSFLVRQITLQLAPCDCAVISCVTNAARRRSLSEVALADRMYYSMKQVAEARTASVRSGRQLLECIIHTRSRPMFARRFRDLIDGGKSPGTYPVCLALASHSLGLPEKSALRVMLYSFSVSVVGAAIRLGILQHFDAQKILGALAAELEKAAISVSAGSTGDLEFMWQLTPIVDILQMKHEHDELRMFVT